ncbi:calcium-independent protein kinase C [Rhizodiscina lignyota]|uniref:protein kinase C n=1 Tax=Rhizodiscina lignyota TaxID=1504668 RepID=A0A9P4M165_9PEZI|nr:calcium-independent protein kinase C [Rhizodiscina lignyota]
MNNEDAVVDNVHKKIEREKALIQAANAMRQSTNNQQVLSRLETQIRDGRRNIEYLEGRLRELEMRRIGSNMDNMNLSAGGDRGPSPPPHDASMGQQGYGQGYPRPGEYDPPGPGQQYSQLSGGSIPMPPNAPFARPGPGAAGPPKSRPNYSRLDLIKYDTPHLGPRIQLMLSQLEFKLSVEKQYKDGIEKMVRLYQLEGDRKSKADAEARRVESNQKIQLLKQALKRYEDLHVDIEGGDERDDDSINMPSVRKPLSGRLSIRIHAVHDVDHAATGRFSRGPETFVIIKVEDVFKGRTRAARGDKWTDELHEFDIDKANEIELTVYDRAGDHPVPIGMIWLRISDIVEELRRKKIETEFNQAGWVSADKMGDGQPGAGMQFKPPPGQGGFTAGGSMAVGLGAAGQGGAPGAPPPQTGQVFVDSWFSLEPAGRIHLTISFIKQNRDRQPFDVGLGRKGAIRQRKEDIVEQYGHKFVQQQFYNIMRCALCGDFLKYAAGMQCSDCKYTCHKKCYTKVVTKCISQSNAETDQDEAKLNHRIPHRFEPFSNMGANWCCHCGYMLPIGKKNSRKCTECSLTCHQQCMHFVPDFCGMSMEVANQILGEIKNAKQRHPSQVSSTGMKKTLRPERPTPVPERTSYGATPEPSQQPSQPRLSYGKEGYDGPPRVQSYGPTSAAAADAARVSYGQGQPASAQQQRPTSGSRTQSQSETAAIAAYSGKAPTSPTKASGQPPYQRQQSDYGADRTSGGYGQGADGRVGYGQGAPPSNQQQTPNVQYNPAAYPPLSASGYPAPQYGAPQQQPQVPPKSPYGQQQQQPLPQPPAHEVPHQQEQPPQQQSQQQVVPQGPPPGKSAPPANTAGTGRRIGLDHFNFLAVLGKGNFGKVMLAETKATKQLYAIKVLKKEFIIENDEVESTRSEKRVFLIANKERHPFLLNLHACFQTETRVYFVMEYISGGDLMLHIQRGQFTTKRAQFYAAEVCLALKYFHENGVIYRDLKLDNILLTLDGHIKIADYGLCKEDMWYGSTTSTFCGTPEFMAPEILLDKKYGRAVDWWAFGVLIYQMLLQQSPFRGEDEDEIYEAILADEPLYPIHMPRDSVSILQKLLTREPEMRLGSGPTDAQEIMSHAFFRNINWDDVYHKRIPAPFLPTINSATDTSNFDQEFTSVTPVLTPVQSVLSQAMQEEFRGFSYSADFA